MPSRPEPRGAGGAAFGLLLAAMTPVPSIAQAPADEQSLPGAQQTITVRGRSGADDRFSSTASTITVERQDIEAMGVGSIGDVMRQLPGMQVSTGGNGGLEIRMRGLGPESTRILIDGVPVSASRRDAQLPLDEMPADLIERIEVVRSPTAQHEGAAGGTINIVLRQARARRETHVWVHDQHVWGRDALNGFFSQSGPLSAGASRGADAGGGASAGSSAPVAAERAEASQWTYFVSLNGGPRNFGNDIRRLSQVRGDTVSSTIALDETFRQRNNNWTLTPRLTGRLGATDQVTIRSIISVLDQAGGVDSNGGGEVGGAATTTATHTRIAFERSFYQVALDWTHRFKSTRLETSMTLERARNDYRIDREQTTTPPNATPTQPSAFANVQGESTVLTTAKLSSTAGDALWTLGGEFDQRRNDVRSTTVTGSASTEADVDASIRRTAIWAQHEMPVDALNATVTAGLRAQGYEIVGNTVSTSLDYRNWFWQPSLNMRARLARDTQLRLNLARVTRTPRLWEMLERAVPSQATNGPNNPDFIGNANLKPEATLSADVGLDQRLAGGGQAGINLFVRSQSDVIARRLLVQGGHWLQQPSNVGDAIVWGLEGDLRRDLRWAGLGPEWMLSTNLSLLQSRMRSGDAIGHRIPGQARYLANLSVSRPMRTSGGWYGGATLALVGASELNTASDTGVTVAGNQRATAQLDLFIGHVDTRWGFWRMNLYNVTDFTRDTRRSIVDANGIVYTDQSLQRQTPRVFLTVGTRF